MSETSLKRLLGLDNSQYAEDHDEEAFHQDDLLQLFPAGLSINNDIQRPFLLLKDQSQQYTLPVAINPLEAGLTLTQTPEAGLAVAPHKFCQLLMKSLEIVPRQCVFVQIKGAHQYVRMYLQGHPATNSIKLRADEAMSLCLHAGVPIYATKEFIRRSRILTSEMENVGSGLKAVPEARLRSHHYLQ